MAGKDKSTFPWKNGHYKVSGNIYRTFFIEGELGAIKQISEEYLPLHFKHGGFGEADPIICKSTGETTYQ